MKTILSKILHIAAILLMVLTVTFTLLGAIGSSCAAFFPEEYASMLPLAAYKLLYQSLIVVSLAAGVAGIRAIVGLIRSSPTAYRQALIVLLVGGGAALVQVIASRMLRGKSMPTDIRLYVTVLTLLVFLLLRVGRIGKTAGFQTGKGSSAGLTDGIAAIVTGILTLTVHLWTAPTHTLGGVNYADAWHVTLALIGWGLSASGVILLGRWRLAGLLSKRPGLEAQRPQST